MTELLSDPAYRHVLLNHIPVIGLIIAFVVLIIGAVFRQTAVLLTGLALVAVSAGLSLPVGIFGNDAYPAVFDRLDGDGRAWLDYHMSLADTWLPVLYTNAAVAVIALGIGILRPPRLRAAALVVTLITLGGIGTSFTIANAGGKIMHPEFRLDDPPVVESSRRLRSP
ncbi:MAG: hypothetical protein O7G86_14665 [Gammaproteobacteria bacterium]|nr:hypothetical protein [Gammaproteobacteria bacterium]